MTSVLPDRPMAKSCAADADCPDKLGCCGMVDPGSATADQLKAVGLPSTKSKVCFDAFTRNLLDGQRTLK